MKGASAHLFFPFTPPLPPAPTISSPLLKRFLPFECCPHLFLVLFTTSCSPSDDAAFNQCPLRVCHPCHCVDGMFGWCGCCCGWLLLCMYHLSSYELKSDVVAGLEHENWSPCPCLADVVQQQTSIVKN
jgi:hypothetical protein